MTKHKNQTPEELEEAKAIARAIQSGQIIDLGSVPSRDLGLVTQGLVQQAAESYWKEAAGNDAEPLNAGISGMVETSNAAPLGTASHKPERLDAADSAGLSDKAKQTPDIPFFG